MIKLFKEVVELIKEDPKEFFGSVALLSLIFGGYYCAIWIGCPS
tara:strand:- start:205 stop:336 length:132 start_codon:yes stop_codon:yes gene_type:complete